MDKWAELGEQRRAARPASGPGGSCMPSLPSRLTISLDLWENYVHGLSQVEFHHGSGRELRAWSRTTQNDRELVASLDGLALLLVFSPKDDVAAISYWQSARELKLLWAKNQPVDDFNQLRYIEELLESAKKGTPAAKMLKIVIPMCREKIFHRVRKLANSFGVSQTNQKLEESNLWRLNKTQEPYQKLEATLKMVNIFKEYESTIHLLDTFTRFMGRVTKTSKVEDFWSIIYFSWCATSVAGLDKILEENQAKYLGKLGDYVRILKRIPLLLKRAGNAKTTIEQVRPPAAEPIKVLSGSLEVLNLRYSHLVSDEMTGIEDWDLVTDVCEKAQPGQPAVGKKKVTFTQHCEITLALDMLKRTQPKFTNSRIEIGVSKTSCEWCYEYLNLLASVYPRHLILVRASHGKQPDGWMMPPNGPKSIAPQMIRLAEGRVDHIIWEINYRRQSDSNELPSFTTGTNMESEREAIAKKKVHFGN